MQNRKFSTSDPALRCSPKEENLTKVDRVIRIPSTPFAIAYSPSNRSPLRTKRQLACLRAFLQPQLQRRYLSLRKLLRPSGQLVAIRRFLLEPLMNLITASGCKGLVSLDRFRF